MLFHLTDQESQVSCLDASARALVPGGRLVIEFHIPDLSGFRDGATCRVARLGPAEVELRVSEHHPIEQKIVSQHVWLGEGKVRVRPVVVRYAWPAETDLMARMAGLDVEARYGDWDRRPFGSDSRTCISVYRKPG
jgi:hypothetical protein